MSQAVQGLILYKRHTPECTVHKTRIPIARRRFWMDCACPIWIYGRTPAGDIVPRQTTRCSELRRAEAVRDSLIAEARTDAVTGPAVAECIEKYLLSREQDLDERTLSQHKLALERLRLFLEAQSVVYLRDVTVDHLETFKTSGLPKKMKSTTRATTIAKVRCFLRVAFRRGWTKLPMVEKMTTVTAVYEQKEPYSDDEVEKILKHAGQLNGGTHGYAARPKTFQLLIELMLSTGMRVGDAVAFDPRQLLKGEALWIYTYQPQKQKRSKRAKLQEAYLSDGLKTRIDNCEWLSARGPFWYGIGADPAPLAQAVYERMQSIGVKAEISDCRPHRLRDTFAVRKLMKGMMLEDVSRLLGHSSVKVTEQYYAKWITSRKRRLEKIVADAM